MRNQLVANLIEQLTCANWEAVLVFDAACQLDPLQRHHTNKVEICFTAEGESADSYLLELASHLRTPTTFVTSDLQLKRQLVHGGAKVLTNASFVKALYKRCQKRPSSPTSSAPPLDHEVERYLESFEKRLKRLNSLDED